LNVAWLPPENVFLRVIELPKSNFEETLAMVELQLEKLSPLPVTQIVWTIHVLSRTHRADGGNGKICRPWSWSSSSAGGGGISRQAGRPMGYLADRLEVPMLDQLEATPATEDGAWIYPLALAGQNAALVAWWCGGALRNLSFVVLPPAGDRAKEFEGPARATGLGRRTGRLADRAAHPKWHLVADPVNAAEWENALREGAERAGAGHAAVAAGGTGRAHGARAAAAVRKAALLPAEFPARTTSNLLTGSGCAVGDDGVLYAVGVVIYFCATSCWLSHARRGAGRWRHQRQLHQRAAAQGALRRAQGAAGVEIRGAGLLENCRGTTARQHHAATIQFCGRPETFVERHGAGRSGQHAL
jgi:hypothetical protein